MDNYSGNSFPLKMNEQSLFCYHSAPLIRALGGMFEKTKSKVDGATSHLRKTNRPGVEQLLSSDNQPGDTFQMRPEPALPHVAAAER